MRSRTLKIYPRPDTEYRKKESIDYQMEKSRIFQTRPKGTFINFQKWIAYFLTGLITGGLVFVWDIGVEYIVEYKWKATQYFLKDDALSIFISYLVYIGICLGFGAAASIITLKLEPLAAGGGTTEMIGYFNGVNYPGVFSFKTLAVKWFGLMWALGSGLCIGKEGVIAHMGSIIGYVVLYLPANFTQYFRNNTDKRDIALAGTAAGIAAAFGSPIGGTLFAYEVAIPASYWNFELMWMIFFCACVSSFFMNVFEALMKGETWAITNAGITKFGEYSNNVYYLYDMIPFTFLGVVGGLLGSFFCFVNYTLGKIRKQYLTTSWRKFAETLALVFLTGTLMFFAPLIVNQCTKIDDGDDKILSILEYTYPYLCAPEYFSPLTTVLFNKLGVVFDVFLDPDVDFGVWSLVAYFLIWYPMTILTYGTNVPAGLFVSGILIGCSYGRLTGRFLKESFGIQTAPATYAIIGAASLLAGYTRHTFSLALIIMESTESIQLFIPVVYSMLISYSVAGLFTRSIYTNAVRSKNIPVLIEHIPKGQDYIQAHNMMSMQPETLTLYPCVAQVSQSLQETSHNGFPVVDSNDCLLGLISRDYLMVLLKKRVFYDSVTQLNVIDEKEVKDKLQYSLQNQDSISYSTNEFQAELLQKEKHKENIGAEYLSWKDFNVGFYDTTEPFSKVQEICEQNMEKIIDLRPFIQFNPPFVHPDDQLQKVLDIFRMLQLRYLPVVENDKKVVGIITRQDIFQYMSI